MKQPSFRFIEEYANFKKKYVCRYAIEKWREIEDGERIDYIVRQCRKGYITVDEAMHELARIGNEERW